MSYERLMNVQFEFYAHEKEALQIPWTARLVWQVLSSQSFIVSKKYTKVLNKATIRHVSNLFRKISKLMLILSLRLALQEFCCVILSILIHVMPISQFIQYFSSTLPAFSAEYTKQRNTSSKSTIEKPEKGLKYVQRC